MSDEQSSRAIKADAKAERARQKALRPWYKKKRFIIPLVLVVLVVLASLGSDDTEVGDGDEQPAGEGFEEAASDSDDTVPVGDSSEAPDEGSEEAAPGSDEMVPMGSPAQDGQFEFTVRDFECGETAVGPEGFEEQAQGQYCIVTMVVENIGNDAQSLFADNQLLIDLQGREFSADSMATLLLEANETFFSEINPGNALEGQVVYDVPKDAQIVSIELHDSALSGGVLVDLRS